MDSRADKIRLEGELEEVKGKRDELEPTDPYYAPQKLAYTQEITAIRNQIAALSTPRQGKFACLFH